MHIHVTERTITLSQGHYNSDLIEGTVWPGQHYM